LTDRRRFLLNSLAGVLAAPLAAGAQQAGKVWRLGVLSPGPSPPGPLEPLREGLHEHGTSKAGTSRSNGASTKDRATDCPV
jgi:hypothetical protein